MPYWSNKLPTHSKHMGFDLIRTPATGTIHATVTSDELLVCDTHYFHGRTMPCERFQTDAAGERIAGNCQACAESMPFRSHVYVSVFDSKTQEHNIFECTTHAAKPLEDYRVAVGTLRGCIIRATRPKGLANSKVIIETNTFNPQRTILPNAPNLILALSVIWRLPPTSLALEHQKGGTNTSDDRRVPAKNHVRTRPEPLNRMRRQPDNSQDPPTIGEVLAGNGRQKQEANLRD